MKMVIVNIEGVCKRETRCRVEYRPDLSDLYYISEPYRN